MAERKDIEKAGGDASANPKGAAQKAARKAAVMSALPAVDSPPLSPAEAEMAPVPTPDAFMIDPVEDAPPIVPSLAPTLETPVVETPKSESIAAPDVAPPVDKPAAPAARPRFAFNASHKRNALLAASVAIAAALGAVFGALASGGFARPAHTDVAGLEERKAMQQSITHLSKEITTLKASVDLANKSAHSQIAKIGDKLSEGLKRGSAEITGSISAPETTAQASMPKAATPIPTPRPPQRLAALETQAPVVQGWSIRGARDGYVYVEGHGDIYQAALGAPLPGLGPVQSIRRHDGRWVVVTPKGIIVSMRDRRYYDPF